RLSKIAGRIDAESFKAETVHFGAVQLKASSVLTLRSLAFKPAEKPLNVIQGPINLVGYQTLVGQTFAFRVTGAVVGGTVYGTGTYTYDSNLAMASVHAGVLKAGQTGVVKVKIIGQHPGFRGSVANGISSFNYGPYQAYEILKK